MGKVRPHERWACRIGAQKTACNAASPSSLIRYWSHVQDPIAIGWCEHALPPSRCSKQHYSITSSA
jgi:hypothetical protein